VLPAACCLPVQVLRASLAGGTSVVLTPGGVAECFYMELEEDKEVVFLKKRTGFVRCVGWGGVGWGGVCLAGQGRAAGATWLLVCHRWPCAY
jgi:hypothetical protein